MEYLIEYLHSSRARLEGRNFQSGGESNRRMKRENATGGKDAGLDEQSLRNLHRDDFPPAGPVYQWMKVWGCELGINSSDDPTSSAVCRNFVSIFHFVHSILLCHAACVLHDVYTCLDSWIVCWNKCFTFSLELERKFASLNITFLVLCILRNWSLGDARETFLLKSVQRNW